MAQHDPFTLDLFGNTSLSSELGLGVTAFPSTVETDGDDTDVPYPPAVARIAPPVDQVASRARAENFYLAGTRGLARSWRDRARDNLSAIRLAAVIEGDQRLATAAEQAQLVRFTGFGASELANGVFRRPGEHDFRDGWEEIGAALESAVGAADYASLARCSRPGSRRLCGRSIRRRVVRDRRAGIRLYA